MIAENKAPGYASTAPIHCKFIKILLEMLENESIKHIIAWGMDGTYFTIFNVEEFIHKVMFTYFKHNRFANFIRLLNMYNFKKIKVMSSVKSSVYMNSNFIRNQPQLLSLIIRKTHNPNLSSTQHRYNESHSSGMLKNCVSTLSRRIQNETYKTEILLQKNRELYQHLSNDFYYIRNLEALLSQLVSQLVTNQSTRSETQARSSLDDTNFNQVQGGEKFLNSEQTKSENPVSDLSLVLGSGSTFVSEGNQRDKGETTQRKLLP